MIENGVITGTVKVSIVQRNGKSFVKINGYSTSADASNVDVNLMYPNVPTFVTNQLSQAINANWRPFKDIMYKSFETYAANIGISILEKMLNNIPVQDFYNM